MSYQLLIPYSGSPWIKVTLAWDDAPWTGNLSSTSTSSTLVNDLDLVVRDPEGNYYTPWRLHVTAHDQSVSPAGKTKKTDQFSKILDEDFDRWNNVEQVYIDAGVFGGALTGGLWSVHVLGALIQPPQRFSLVATYGERPPLKLPRELNPRVKIIFSIDECILTRGCPREIPIPKPGFGVGLYQDLNKTYTVGLEYDYNTFHFNDDDIELEPGFDSIEVEGGKLNTQRLSLNLFRFLKGPTRESRLYLRGGLGLAWTRRDALRIERTQGGVSAQERIAFDSDIAPSLSTGVGLEWPLSDRAIFSVEGTYNHIFADTHYDNGISFVSVGIGLEFDIFGRNDVFP